MALGDEMVGGNDKGDDDDMASDDLLKEVDELSAALESQDKLLRRAARDRKEVRDKVVSLEKELETARASLVVVTDETECDACVIYMSTITTLQSKYSSVLDEHDELKSRSSLLGACQSCPGLQSELVEKKLLG